MQHEMYPTLASRLLRISQYIIPLQETTPVNRRALLTLLFPALAGCSIAPNSPTTNRYPTSGPNIFASFDWDSGHTELTVTFKRGNYVTTANTSRLAVVTRELDSTETVWVDRDDAADPVAEFPLTPGETLIHTIPAPATTRLIWVAPDTNVSKVVTVWNPESDTSGAEE